MSDHTWTQENIASYVAGGLDAAERERLEQHAADCGDCAAAPGCGPGLDRNIGTLFAGTGLRPRRWKIAWFGACGSRTPSRRRRCRDAR